MSGIAGGYEDEIDDKLDITNNLLTSIKDNQGYSVSIENEVGATINPSTEEKQDTLIANQTNGASKTVIYGKTGDTTTQAPRLDTATHTLQTIEYEHHEIHAGSHFFIDDYVDLSINNVFDVQFTTPAGAKWTHFTFDIQCESETLWHIYEGATINLAGTALTPRNNDRNSLTTSINTVAGITNASLVDANTDTAVAGATLLAEGIVSSGKGSLGATSRDREIILKANTVYCMRAIANAAGYIDFLMEWYEHTNKTA